MFVSEKSIVFSYIFLLGYYPILKVYIEKLRLVFCRYILKIGVFLISLCLYMGIFVAFFEVDLLGKYSVWIWILGSLAFLISCLIYDFFLTIFVIYYIEKLKPKIFKYIFK